MRRGLAHRWIRLPRLVRFAILIGPMVGLAIGVTVVFQAVPQNLGEWLLLIAGTTVGVVVFVEAAQAILERMPGAMRDPVSEADKREASAPDERCLIERERLFEALIDAGHQVEDGFNRDVSKRDAARKRLTEVSRLAKVKEIYLYPELRDVVLAYLDCLFEDLTDFESYITGGEPVGKLRWGERATKRYEARERMVAEFRKRP